jgi:predicted patatin/cPLA2 family phospholipase
MRTLVLDGGGQLGCFTWGVLIELYRLGLRPGYFSDYIATSAGVFNSAYFVTEQIEEGLRIWTQHLPRGFWKWYKNDMKYLERVLREIEPLQYSILRESRQKIFAAFSNPDSLLSEIICLNTAADPIEVMLASAAMPFLTGARVINGQQYYDAGLISQPPIDHIPLGSNSEIWVLLATPRGYRLRPAGWKVLSCLALHDTQVRKLLWGCPSHRNNLLCEIEGNASLKIIQPKQALPIGWRSTDEKAIAHTVQLGREAALQFAREY